METIHDEQQPNLLDDRADMSLHLIQLKSSVAVVVAQLVERSLRTPEVHDSNPVIGKHL